MLFSMRQIFYCTILIYNYLLELLSDFIKDLKRIIIKYVKWVKIINLS